MAMVAQPAILALTDDSFSALVPVVSVAALSEAFFFHADFGQFFFEAFLVASSDDWKSKR